MAEEENAHAESISSQVFELMQEKISKSEDATFLIKFFGTLTDIGYLSADAFEKTLTQLLDIHEKSHKQSNYFLHLALVGYVFGSKALKDSTIKKRLETHIQAAAQAKDIEKSDSFESCIDQLWSIITSCDKEETLVENKIYDLYLRPNQEYIQELTGKNHHKILSLPDIRFEQEAKFFKAPDYFQLFSERCVASSDIATYALARDLVRSVLLAFSDNAYFACQRLTTLQNVPCLPYLIFDVILDEVLREPTPIKRPVYFSSICATMINEFTKNGEFEFGPSVGEALQIIFGTGDVADTSTQGQQFK
jgi:hypothetical protein